MRAKIDAAMVETLISAARAHGEQSEPDMEIGDLQDILRTCWRLMCPAERKAAYAQHSNLISDWLFETS